MQTNQPMILWIHVMVTPVSSEFYVAPAVTFYNCDYYV